jgi:hypothetical protein
MALIDLDANGVLADNLLKQSTQGRNGSPDGNIYFDLANGTIELITESELATVDFGSGAVENPLKDVDGITMKALYGFERTERRADENLRKYQKYFEGTFKYSGAYEIVNGRKFAGDDRDKIRNSGLIERAGNSQIDRIYFGGVSLGNVEETSQPKYQLSEGGEVFDLAKAGDMNEMIQVYGTTANGDTGAGDFDNRQYMAFVLRTFGYTYSKKVLGDSGLVEMSGYSAGFGLSESQHPTTKNYSLEDVYGGSAIAPFTGLSLEKLATPTTQSGFVEANGDFTWVLRNSANATLDECIAYLDALAQTDDDIDSGSETVTHGLRVNEWYVSADGIITTQSGADSLGLFIENIPASDLQRVKFTDDNGDVKTYPFYVQVNIDVGQFAKADTNAWYTVYYKDGAGASDFNTSNAVIVQDATNVDVSGDVGGQDIVFNYAYDTNTQAGLNAAEDKVMIVEVEGHGVATAAMTEFTVTRTGIVSVTCSPTAEQNL